jgi:hypothetical protein
VMTRASALFALVLAVGISIFAAGCAAPGDPTPRHPVVPARITDLRAQQVGSEAILVFTLPTRSTDGEVLAEHPSIEIYRTELAPGATVDRKTRWNLTYTIPAARVDAYLKNSHLEFRDPLPPDFLANVAGSQLAYLIRSRSVRARASEDSNVIIQRIYPPPSAPANVQTAVSESVITIRWEETGPPTGAAFSGYHVYRTRVEPAQPGAPSGSSPVKSKSSPELLSTVTTPEYQDTHFEFGETYAYTTRTIAAFGGDQVESADSAAAVVSARDIFPPGAPVGLEAAIVPATPQTGSYVELSWAISPEPDLAGYRVYRSDREEAVGERQNAELLLSPAFRDMSVVSGGRYFYRVAAVDRSGNESSMSSVVIAPIP